MKRIKYLSLWVTSVVLLWNLMSPEQKTFNLTDGTESSDYRLPLLDHKDLVFVPNGDYAEGLETLMVGITFYFGIILAFQLVGLMPRILESDFIEGRALIISQLAYLWGSLLLFYLISFTTYISPGLFILLGVVFIVVHGIMSGMSISKIVEEDEGLFNVYNSMKDYFKEKEKYDSYIKNLKYQYKLKLK